MRAARRRRRRAAARTPASPPQRRKRRCRSRPPPRVRRRRASANLRIGYVSSGNEVVLVVLLKRAYSGGCLSVEYSVAGVDANVNNNKKLIWNGAANLLADGTTHYYLGGRENGNGAPTVIPLTTFDRTVSTDVTAFACLGDGLVMYDIAL